MATRGGKASPTMLIGDAAMTSILDDARGELLACPRCHSEVVMEHMDFYCNGCGANTTFPICSVTSHAIRLWNTRAAPVPQCDAALIAEEFYKTIPEEKGMLRGNAKGFGLMIAEAIRAADQGTVAVASTDHGKTHE